MVQYLELIGESGHGEQVLDFAVRWGATLAANMALPDPALTADQPSLPVALRLLVDRLDCPSRMVQERATWALTELLANPDTCPDTTKALLDWHAAEPLELRSCMLLLILHLARTVRGFATDTCVIIALEANIVPSIGADLLLREFGEDGAAWSSLCYLAKLSYPALGSSYRRFLSH